MFSLFHVAAPAAPVTEQKYKTPLKYNISPAVPAVPTDVGALPMLPPDHLLICALVLDVVANSTNPGVPEVREAKNVLSVTVPTRAPFW